MSIFSFYSSGKKEKQSLGFKNMKDIQESSVYNFFFFTECSYLFSVLIFVAAHRLSLVAVSWATL